MNLKVLTVCFFCALICMPVFPAESVRVDSSVLIPKDVYVGDAAELRLTIDTSVLLLPDTADAESYVPDPALFASAADSCTVNKLVLQKLNSGYSLSVFFIPWKPGVLIFPPIDLTVFPAVRALLAENPDFHPQIELGRVTISSIAAKMNETKLRPSAAPVIVPGTTYLVYGTVVVILILCICIILVIVKLKSVLLFWKNQAARQRFFRNYRGTLSKIKKLKRSGSEPAEFAARLEHILRIYLEKRFAYPFSSAVPAEIPAIFDLLCGGTLDPVQFDAVELLCGIFRRCDYIRFFPPARQEAVDLEQIVTDVHSCLHIFEKGTV